MVKNHRWVVQEELKDTKTVGNEGDTCYLECRSHGWDDGS